MVYGDVCGRSVYKTEKLDVTKLLKKRETDCALETNVRETYLMTNRF